MDVKLKQIREDIIIGGFSIESTGETYNKDLEVFYHDFTNDGKMELLNNITKNNHEYYAVTWYDEFTIKDFVWLLGQKINKNIDSLEIKVIKKGEYAVCKFPPRYDSLKAWTDLYAEGITGMGYKYIEENNIAFIHYSNGLDGETEYCVLVEKM